MWPNNKTIQKLTNVNVAIKENVKEYNPNWPQILDHPYRILIIGGYGSGKTNLLFNLINHQLDIDKIYLYTNDPYEAKYQFLIKNREDIGAKHLNDSKFFIEFSNDMDDIYKKHWRIQPKLKT